MSGKAAKIQITEKQHRILQQVDRSATAQKRLVQRVGVILMGFAGMLNVTIAQELGLVRKQVGLWRRRWQLSFDALVAIECHESQAALRLAIEDVLSDAPRSGSTGTFTAEGYPGVRFEIDRSDAIGDGGIPGVLMSIISTV